MKDSPSAPAAVDPYVQAAAQYGLNRDTALLGNQLAKTNSYSPTESTTWSSEIDPQDQARYNTEMAQYNTDLSRYNTARDTYATNRPSQWTPHSDQRTANAGGGSWGAAGSAPFSLQAPNAPRAPTASKWTSTTKLTPDQQRLFDLRENAQETLLGQANKNLQQPLDFSKLNKQVTNLGLNNDFSGERQRVEDALYQRSASRLDPQFALGQKDLETKLYNQGVQPGTEAWNRELASHAQQKQDAYGGARTDAITGGGDEQSRLFGMAYQTADRNAALQNQARQQGLNELFAMRQTPLQELNLLSGNTPGAAGAGAAGGGGQGVDNTDISGAFNQQLSAQQAAHTGQVNTNNANTSAAASTIAAAITAFA